MTKLQIVLPITGMITIYELLWLGSFNFGPPEVDAILLLLLLSVGIMAFRLAKGMETK